MDSLAWFFGELLEGAGLRRLCNGGLIIGVGMSRVGFGRVSGSPCYFRSMTPNLLRLIAL